MRVGGPDGGAGEEQVAAKTLLRIRRGNVVGDNLWLWRADHTDNGHTTPTECKANNALVVDGDDVTMVGLAAEHAQDDITLWNGERGRTYFYQCELPYGPDDSDGKWTNGEKVGYRVAEGVKDHDAWGIGVYSYFRDHNVVAKSGIACPEALESRFHSSVTVKLNGYGSIAHVINDKKGVLGNCANSDPTIFGSGPVYYVQ